MGGFCLSVGGVLISRRHCRPIAGIIFTRRSFPLCELEGNVFYSLLIIFFLPSLSPPLLFFHSSSSSSPSSPLPHILLPSYSSSSSPPLFPHLLIPLFSPSPSFSSPPPLLPFSPTFSSPTFSSPCYSPPTFSFPFRPPPQPLLHSLLSTFLRYLKAYIFTSLNLLDNPQEGEYIFIQEYGHSLGYKLDKADELGETVNPIFREPLSAVSRLSPLLYGCYSDKWYQGGHVTARHHLTTIAPWRHYSITPRLKVHRSLPGHQGQRTWRQRVVQNKWTMTRKIKCKVIILYLAELGFPSCSILLGNITYLYTIHFLRWKFR